MDAFAFFLFFLFFNFSLMAQDQFPLEAIPAAPESTTSGKRIGANDPRVWVIVIIGRPKIYGKRTWITAPAQKRLSTYETLGAPLRLGGNDSQCGTINSKRTRPLSPMPEDYLALRSATLKLLEEASQLFLKKDAAAIEALQLIIQRGGKTYTFPIWNLMNGPLSDALYHTGQVVSFRRTTGNPIHPGVNVFMEKPSFNAYFIYPPKSATRKP